MESTTIVFDATKAVEHLRHYLPSQAALKDFVHHNTLHVFQHEKFHDALWKSSKIFGYSSYLSLEEFREYYASGKINPEILDRIIAQYIQENHFENFDFKSLKSKILTEQFQCNIESRIGQLRSVWKNEYGFNLDKVVHPILFRMLSAFLDQGISFWKFPVENKSFLNALREIEKNGFISLFKGKRAKKILLDELLSLQDLLHILIGEERYFEQYLFDQQLAHPGWSGFVAVVEVQPETLLQTKQISLHDLIYFELLLEIDALDKKFGEQWLPLSKKIKNQPKALFSPVAINDLKIVLQLWQEAFEWTYFDAVLSGIKQSKTIEKKQKTSFQGLFCIDDREYSFRRHIEQIDTNCETFGTPGFFGVEFYFQPENGKFYTKACPAPVKPQFLIKEKSRKSNHQKDVHYHQQTHSLLRGWLVSAPLGFSSAIKLFANIFKPSVSPATAYSFLHMDKNATLSIESLGEKEGELNIGFTIPEMALRVKNVLKSIGLTQNFAPIVYIVGHGGSSVNNTYYAGYDCGACCGRPGAVNARVFAFMANKTEVRVLLKNDGIEIPETTFFIGAMHDTTRDEIEFYDDLIVSPHWLHLHLNNQKVFQKALQQNAKERALRFDNVAKNVTIEKLHKAVKERSVSLFEPRPEWNHTDNALCIIGRKCLYQHLYLDKRPFINSYDYSQDPEGNYLLSILNAAIPVCGGINLEYYFSRVDQQNLGAGTKLPHNVVGLFAVANGIDGDLRSGLPSQMIEIHDPVRILFIIEHNHEVVLNVIQRNPAIYEWVKNEWVLLSVKNPETNEVFTFRNEHFEPYLPQNKLLKADISLAEIENKIRKTEPMLFTF